jgi:hypothetical protein
MRGSILRQNCDLDRSGEICDSFLAVSAQKIGDSSYHYLLFLRRELGEDGERQYFRRGTLTFREGSCRIAQALHCWLLMQSQGIVNL